LPLPSHLAFFLPSSRASFHKVLIFLFVYKFIVYFVGNIIV
jgi:hypothetical protein